MPTINRTTITTRPVSNNSQETVTTVEYDTVNYTRKMDMGDYIVLSFLALIIIVGIIGFIKSIRSRKYYKCPECGESFRSENMTSQTCKVCGARLEETDDPNITDKTK